MKHIGLALAVLLIQVLPAHAAGDAKRGAQVFRTCAACHSLEPDRNMTGPSLAGVWDRQAGKLPSFSRYSEAMKKADVVWNEKNLDAYLKNPAAFIPGNHMTFPGLADAKARADVIAFLKQSAAGRQQQSAQSGMGGGMGGMHGGGVPNLKNIEASGRVKTITYCRDTYTVTTADGQSRQFWERNLRFKTDSSGDGPDRNAPAIVGAGMMGDRASVIFAAPEEISRFITHSC